MHGEVTARLRELHTTIEAGARHREAVLPNIAFNLDQWATQARSTQCAVCVMCLGSTCCGVLCQAGVRWGVLHVFWVDG